MPVDRCVFVIELDVTGPKVRMIGVLVKTKHQVSVGFDPVDAVVFVVDTDGVPEANLQSYSRRVVGLTSSHGKPWDSSGGDVGYAVPTEASFPSPVLRFVRSSLGLTLSGECGISDQSWSSHLRRA